MAHEIWGNEMVYVGEVPWHGIGTQVSADITGEELKGMLNLSEVALLPMFVYGANGNPQKVPGHRASVRTKDSTILGVVGEEFAPLQDEELIDTLDVLRQEGLAAFETAGLLKGGSRFFVMMKVPNGLLRLKTPNGKEDIVLQYLAASHGHDGSLRFEFSPTNVRVVCQNTVNMARREAREQGVSFAIKHTASAQHRVEQAIEAYRRTMEFQRDFAEKAQVLVDTSFSFEQMKKLSDFIFPVPPGKESNIPAGIIKARYETQRLFIEGQGHQELGIVGTAWGAYNAVVEYLDWNRPTRGDKDFTEGEKKAKRWEASQFNPLLVEQKLNALAKVEELVAA